MEPTIVRDAETAALLAARRIAERLRAAPDLVLGLATGRTMQRVYAELVRMHRDESLGFGACRTFNLDEYAGLPAEHPNAYRRFMRLHLFDLVDIDARRTHVPDGLADDPHAEGVRYEAMIRESGGIDLQLLGIGENGHIGFNEPGSAFSSRTRCVELTPRTRRQNAGMFDGEQKVPCRAITVGIATILEARSILLLATGRDKASALEEALHGPPTPETPASALQTHPRCEVIVDEAAASMLRL